MMPVPSATNLRTRSSCQCALHLTGLESAAEDTTDIVVAVTAAAAVVLQPADDLLSMADRLWESPYLREIPVANRPWESPYLRHMLDVAAVAVAAVILQPADDLLSSPPPKKMNFRMETPYPPPDAEPYCQNCCSSHY